jgi:hypothetical protein
MTTKELYRIAYKRVRAINNTNTQSIGDGSKREPLEPIAVPQHIIAFARTSYKQRNAIEIIDPLRLGEWYD